MNDYEVERVKRIAYTKGLKAGQEVAVKVDYLTWLMEVLSETKGVGDVLYKKIMSKAQEKKQWEGE